MSLVIKALASFLRVAHPVWPVDQSEDWFRSNKGTFAFPVKRVDEKIFLGSYVIFKTKIFLPVCKIPTDKYQLSCNTLEQTLTRLGLQQYLDIFQKESLDLESLVMHAHKWRNKSGVSPVYVCDCDGRTSVLLKALCQDSDLKDLGIPLGARKKILNHVRRKFLLQVRPWKWTLG